MILTLTNSFLYLFCSSKISHLEYLFNPFTLSLSLERIVCYSHTFEHNLRIKRKFTKYLKESCCLTFLLQIFSKKWFCKENISKIVRPVSAALSVNRLSCYPMLGHLNKCRKHEPDILKTTWPERER